MSPGRTTLLLAGVAAMALGAWWLAGKEAAEPRETDVPNGRPKSAGILEQSASQPRRTSLPARVDPRSRETP